MIRSDFPKTTCASSTKISHCRFVQLFQSAHMTVTANIGTLWSKQVASNPTKKAKVILLSMLTVGYLWPYAMLQSKLPCEVLAAISLIGLYMRSWWCLSDILSKSLKNIQRTHKVRGAALRCQSNSPYNSSINYTQSAKHLGPLLVSVLESRATAGGKRALLTLKELSFMRA